MAGIETQNIVAGIAKITGAKDEVNLVTVTQAIADLIKTELDGTVDTHEGYAVQVKVKKLGV